jgi:hypothetical protein
VGTGAGPDAVEKGKILSLTLVGIEALSSSPARSLVTILTELRRL